MKPDQSTIKSLEKFKGELNGEYQTLWVAVDKNNQLYLTHDIQLKQVGNNVITDFDATKWKAITNEFYNKITDEMTNVSQDQRSRIGETQSNLQPNKTIMENKQEQAEIKIKGYLGKDHHYKAFESGKSAITATIKPSAKKGEETQWVQFKAWETLAERIKEGIEKEGVKKLTLTGKFKEVTFEGKNGPKTIQEFQVSQIQKHKMMEISGTIDKVFEKETTNKKAYTELVVISDQVKDGNPSKERFTVTVWNDKKNQIPKEVELKAGNSIAIKGEATILENQGATEKYYKLAARNIDKDISSLKTQIETKIASAQQRKANPTKAKGPSIEV